MCGKIIMATYDEALDIISAIEFGTSYHGDPDAPARPATPGSHVPVIVPVDAPASEPANVPTDAPANVPAYASANPAGGEAPAALAAEVLLWGFKPEWTSSTLFNTRIEKAFGPQPGYWSTMARTGRCIVPTFGFFEPHGTQTMPSPRTGKPIKAQYFFQQASAQQAPDPCAPGLYARAQQAPSPGLSSVTFLAALRGQGRFSIVTTQPNSQMAPIHGRMPLVLRPGEFKEWLYGDPLRLADRSSIELAVHPPQPPASPTQATLDMSF